MNTLETIQDLYTKYGELDGITIEVQNELLAIGIQNQTATAEIFLQGAQVSRYQRANEKPILWLSKQCEYKQGSPLRGGIPICWPWFGDLNKNPKVIRSQFSQGNIEQATAHGFIRKRNWQVADIRTPTKDTTIIDLCYVIEAENESLWPFATELRYSIEIGSQLKASLNVINKDSRAFTYSCALHSYFTVDNIHHATITGFDKSEYLDTLNNWQQQIQNNDINFNQEVDRIYQSAPEDIQLNDQNRTINIKSTGSASTVVWNPWIEKSKGLSQIKPDAYLKMLCIETANILEDAVYLEPNEEHKLELVIE